MHPNAIYIYAFTQAAVEAMKGIAGGFGQMFGALAAGVPRYFVDRKDIEIDGT